MKSRQFVLLVLFLLAIPSPMIAFVTELEPNNTSAQANRVTCGDTVLCATLDPASDLDHFCFAAFAGDSIILATLPCAGSETNTILVLFSSADSILAVDDNGGEQAFSLIRYRAGYTGDYVIRVLRHGIGDSTYSLAVRCPHIPPEDYDRCTSPRIIPSFPYYDEGSTRGQNDDCRGTSAPDVFYKFYNPATSNILITLCSDNFDARVQLMSRCCGGFLDDADEGCRQGANLTCLNLPPGVYFVMVEGVRATDAGEFSLEVAATMPGCPPPERVVITTVGGYPFLDWPQAVGPSYFVVWSTTNPAGPWEHLGTTVFTFFTDSTGYAGLRKFYQVTSVCPW